MTRTGKPTPEMATIAELTKLPERDIKNVVRAIAALIERNDKVSVRGLGTFTWRPYSGRLPGGERFRTRRLWFSSWSIKRKGDGDVSGNLSQTLP